MDELNLKTKLVLKKHILDECKENHSLREKMFVNQITKKGYTLNA